MSMGSTREHLRLEEDRQRLAYWKRWGPYLSERAWGSVREDYSPGGTPWEYLPHHHPPPPSPALPVEGRRPGRHLRPPPAHLLRDRALESSRSDPEGTSLRPDRKRRQPRRRRQGVLLLRR